MRQIRLAENLLEKVEFNNIDDYETSPSSVLSCKNCGDKVGVALRDLMTHNFSKKTNLKQVDKNEIERLMLAMIPKYKLNPERNYGYLTKNDRLIVWVQRLYLRLIGVKGKFPSIPTTKDYMPDSFLDYYCPQCKMPTRIYYYNYIGGRHCETGYGLKYIVN